MAEPTPYHQLLQQQLISLGEHNLEIVGPMAVLLQKVSDSYTELEAINQHRTDQLISSTSRAYSFLDSLNKGFIMCDVNGEVVLTNNSVRQTMSQKAQPGSTYNLQTIDQLFAPQIHLKKLIADCLKSSQAMECNDIIFGSYVLRLYIAPLLNEAKTEETQLLGVVILVEDITEQKGLDRAKDEFLSIASHELRTPLTAIRGNASLIKTYYADSITNKDMVEMIDDIHESSTRLIEIVNDFLDVASFEQGKILMEPEIFAPNKVIHDVVRELSQLCEAKNIELMADPSVDMLPTINADRQRFNQVLTNLVGNSVKFTDKGSIIISGQTNQSFVQFLVTDTGRGMSPENQTLLFRKFQQAGSSLLTRDTTKGTGLGLYICRLIVELSGGTISLLSSELDHGSVFSFTMPVA